MAMQTLENDIPPQYEYSQQDAMTALQKFQTSSQPQNENSSLLHLLTHGLTSQAKVIQELCTKFGTLKTDGEIGAELIEKWNHSLDTCRRIQKTAYTQFQEEKGKLIGEDDLKLIFEVPGEIVDGKDQLPENCLKNLSQFSGESVQDLDITTENFIRSAFEIGSSQKLSYEGIKNLILRRLHGYSLLILETYSGNLGKSPGDLTLKQVLWCLEKHFRQDSSPLKSLQKLQALPQINDKQYFKMCGLINRLAKLSVKNESNSANAKVLEEARATEYFIKSLSLPDKKLVDKANAQRLTENREPLNSIAIADFLTKHHQNTYDTPSPPHSSIMQAKQGEDNPDLEKNEEICFFSPPQRGFKRNFGQKNQGNFAYLRGSNRPQVGTNRPPFIDSRMPTRGAYSSNQRFPSNRRGGGPPQSFPQKPQFTNSYPQFRNYRPFAPPTHDRGRNTARGRGFINQFRGQRHFNQGNNLRQRGPPPQNAQYPSSRPFVTTQQAGVGPQDCILCGGPHSLKSPLCRYFGTTPVPVRCKNHDPPRFAHPQNRCQGDFVTRKVQKEESEHSFMLD